MPNVTGLGWSTVAPSSALRASGSSLDLRADPIELTAALVDIPSESRHEKRIADEVEAALRAQAKGYEVIRNGDAVLARTNFGRPSRVLLAGHLDTVPAADNVPSRLVGDELFGCGTSDMKSGDAVFLHLAATIAEPSHDITLVMYDCEEIESSANGLGRIERELPEWLQADVAILGEPSGGYVEAGCQGTIRVVVRAAGTRAHSARAWLGDNAIHKLGAVLDRLSSYRPRNVDIDGCTYREGLSAVRIDGGIAGNVIPDAASVTVNFRFAPDRSVEQAVAHVHEVLDGLDVDVERTDAAAGALPGLTKPAAAALVQAAGGQVRAKYGWTDVARFAALGIPAVNYGPGDPNMAHRVDERVDVRQITAATEMLRKYLVD
ncbi:MAG: succinyl-diaminopimelate desuccinylase [Mycolicibacterium sp.]|nr:succinyl-diaminopimelate desuccinylase [Mycolicibacterium sp.]